MAKTYNTISTFTSGQVLTAAQMNEIGTNSNNYRVPASCSVYFGTNSTYTENTDIAWTAQDYTNTDSMWTSGATVTINTAGLYLVTFTGRATNTSSTGARAVLLFSGTTTELQSQAETTTDFRWSISAVRSLAAASTLTARLQWSPGTVTLQGASDLRPTLTVSWLGQVS
jgi:hypothetical protein